MYVIYCYIRTVRGLSTGAHVEHGLEPVDEGSHGNRCLYMCLISHSSVGESSNASKIDSRFSLSPHIVVHTVHSALVWNVRTCSQAKYTEVKKKRFIVKTEIFLYNDVTRLIIYR